MGDVTKRIDTPYLRGDKELALYLCGVSVPVLSELRKLGLPYHKINSIYLYDRDEVRTWINSRTDIVTDDDKPAREIEFTRPKFRRPRQKTK